MTDDQLNLFAFDAQSEGDNSLLGNVSNKPDSKEFNRWTFFRNGYMASFEEKTLKTLWVNDISRTNNGQCPCLDFSKSGSCQHTKDFQVWLNKTFPISKISLGKQFELSQWIGLGQNWFREWMKLEVKVKLPSLMQFFDKEGTLRVEFRSRNLGQILFEEFYGLLCHLDEEALRKLRVPGEVRPLEWDTFYNQSLTSTELNLKVQNMQTLGQLFDASLLGALVRHGSVFFKDSDQNPAQLQLNHKELEIKFFP